jgi:hypothetical protein
MPITQFAPVPTKDLYDQFFGFKEEMFKPLTPKFEALTYDSHLIVRNLGGALIFGISLPFISFLAMLIILHLAKNFGGPN